MVDAKYGSLWGGWCSRSRIITIVFALLLLFFSLEDYLEGESSTKDNVLLLNSCLGETFD